MGDKEWHQFFIACAQVLGVGDQNPRASQSWGAWTTFSALELGVHYWSSGMPNFSEIAETHIVDSSTWNQPFTYASLAHVVVPATFYWETTGTPEYANGFKNQDILKLSEALNSLNIRHRVTELVLEIKLY